MEHPSKDTIGTPIGWRAYQRTDQLKIGYESQSKDFAETKDLVGLWFKNAPAAILQQTLIVLDKRVVRFRNVGRGSRRYVDHVEYPMGIWWILDVRRLLTRLQI